MEDLTVERLKNEIAHRAFYAGMDFDLKHLVYAPDEGVVCLTHTRQAKYDEDGILIGYDYVPLMLAEYFKCSDKQCAYPHIFGNMHVRVAMLCPWLVFMVMPDGSIRDGANEQLEDCFVQRWWDNERMLQVGRGTDKRPHVASLDGEG